VGPWTTSDMGHGVDGILLRQYENVIITEQYTFPGSYTGCGWRVEKKNQTAILSCHLAYPLILVTRLKRADT
jgi:hypothetical protein